ncbi:MAG: hypothetical protein AAGJ18_02120 [Bacteroidota bacterium]
MTKRFLILLCFFSLNVSSLIAQDDSATTEADKFQLDIGGALRFNYNLSSWKPNQRQRGGDFGYEVFRITVDANYRKLGFHLDHRFYAVGFGGDFMKYGWMQYNFDDKSHMKLGLIPAYFGVQQFNSHSWFFQLPFYLGFEDDHDMGISYDFENEKIQLDIGFYKNAEELGFSDNSPISDSRYNYDFSGRNKEINQFNLRFNYKFGQKAKHIVGTSLQYGGIWNIDTKSVGSQAAMGLQYEMNYQNWNVKAQYLTYDNQPQNATGQSRDFIQMTAYGAPYNTAAKASIYSFSIAYTLPLTWGPITSLQFYNDYSYMDKAVATWEDTQMNVLGMLISANPMFIYVDYAMGKHQPWLGPQWTDALSAGDTSNGWEARFNVNFGYYF